MAAGIAQFGQEASSNSIKGKRDYTLLWTFNAAEIFLYPSPHLGLDRILSRRSTDNFLAWFVLWHTLLSVRPYIDRCVPNHVQSTELTTGGLQSSCRNILWMIRMHLSSILSFMSNTVNTYVHVIFNFLINLQRFQTNFFHAVAARAF